jgi:hypothetical protein
MKHTAETGSDTMMYVSRLIKFGSSIQKAMGGTYMYRHRQLGDLMNPLFFQNCKPMLKMYLGNIRAYRRGRVGCRIGAELLGVSDTALNLRCHAMTSPE